MGLNHFGHMRKDALKNLISIKKNVSFDSIIETKNYIYYS